LIISESPKDFQELQDNHGDSTGPALRKPAAEGLTERAHQALLARLRAGSPDPMAQAAE